MRSAPSWIADEGPGVLEPLGVLSGMVSAAATCASRRARSRWLGPLDWERVIRAFVGRRAALPVVKDLREPGAPHLEQTVISSEFD